MTLKELKEIYSGDTYVDEDVLKFAPSTEGELKFFKLAKFTSPQELQEEYKKRKLAPASIKSLAEWSEKNQNSKKQYVATQWKDEAGEFCYASFSGWHGRRDVNVGRNDGDWHDDWWLAGSTQKSELNPTPFDLSSLDLEITEIKINGKTYKLI